MINNNREGNNLHNIRRISRQVYAMIQHVTDKYNPILAYPSLVSYKSNELSVEYLD